MRKIFLIVAALAVSFFTGSAIATFDYAMNPAEEGTLSVVGSISGFDYSGSIDYPEDFDTDHKQVVDIAVSTEDGGLNDTDDIYGKFRIFITNPYYFGRTNQFGYVGSMDADIGSSFREGNDAVPKEISFVMTLPQYGSEKPLYLYLSKITDENLQSKSVGDMMRVPVFRVKLEKNAEGIYEQTECKRGYSRVTTYDDWNGGLKAFAFTTSNGEVWIEGDPA